ncbi:sialidase family protein [Streptomyces sp. NPDC001941]|uniref:sialidase family protein n=1 Tax=Streptomyces sp. NPDC001941 TaxID=3154659 RepID=UPI003328DB9D
MLLAGCTGRGGTASGGRPGGASQVAGGASGAATPVPFGWDLPGASYEAELAADGSGFGVLVECVEGVPGGPEGFCRQHVAVLDRGASHWALRKSPLPELAASQGSTTRLVVFGGGRAWLEEGGAADPGRDGEAGARAGRTWFTSDGGRSWSEGRARGEVAAIPGGGVLGAECAEPPGPDTGGCRTARLVVLSPVDGSLRALARGPALAADGLRAAERAEPDGSWWVTGRDPVTGRAAVASSRDGGRSWTVARLPGAAWDARGVVVTAGRDAVYAAELGPVAGAEAAKNPLRALYRSADGGRSWQRVYATRPGTGPQTLLGRVVVRADGSLLLSGEGRSYESRDGGRTFTGTAGHGWVRRTPAGYQAAGSECAHSVSRDGETWDEFVLGCGPE